MFPKHLLWLDLTNTPTMPLDLSQNSAKCNVRSHNSTHPVEALYRGRGKKHVFCLLICELIDVCRMDPKLGRKMIWVGVTVNGMEQRPESMRVHEQHLKSLVYPIPDTQTLASYVCSITDSSVKLWRILSVQDILSRTDTRCHMCSTCDHHTILQPEGASAQSQNSLARLIRVTNHCIKPWGIIVRQTIFLGSEKWSRCFNSGIKTSQYNVVRLPLSLLPSFCKDKDLMYWAAEKHLPSTSKQVIKPFIKITLWQRHWKLSALVWDQTKRLPGDVH